MIKCSLETMGPNPRAAAKLLNCLTDSYSDIVPFYLYEKDMKIFKQKCDEFQLIEQSESTSK